jgi:hypothetical protein
MTIRRVFARAVVVFWAATPWVCGQSADTPIYQQGGHGKKEANQRIIEQMHRLRKEGKLIAKNVIDKQMLEPKQQVVELQPVRDKGMPAHEVAAWARKTNLRVGYCYQCPRCDDWHLNLAGGYAIAEDVIVTCDHVLKTKTKMRDGYLLAVDHDGNVAGTVAVLARSEAMDVAILQVTGAKFTPVSLHRDVRQGAASYCFSHPLRQQGYFSEGIVNRFYWADTYRGEKEDTLDALRHLRVNFSNDWAPGSSGSPLFDQAGNVVGHVSTIAGLSHGSEKSPLMTLHTGAPARSVEALARAMSDPAEIQRIVGLDAKQE